MGYSIYILRDPRSAEPRYVGMTSSPKSRLRSHINKGRNYPGRGRRNAWVHSLLNNSVVPEMEVLQEDLSKEDAEAWETYWWSHYMSLDCRLTNDAPPGGAPPLGAHAGHKHSEEARRKMSEAHKSREDYGNWTMRGKKHSPETKAKMSAAHKGNQNAKDPSPEARRKMSEAKKGKAPHNKGKPMSEEQKRKISESRRRNKERQVV